MTGRGAKAGLRKEVGRLSHWGLDTLACPVWPGWPGDCGVVPFAGRSSEEFRSGRPARRRSMLP